MKATVALVSGLILLAAGCSTQPASHAAPARVEVSVTDAGFVPSEIKVRAGAPVTLVVTRKVEQTCATGIVLDPPGIRKELPLNQPVEITFTPNRSGAEFSCPMHMISGRVSVQ